MLSQRDKDELKQKQIKKQEQPEREVQQPKKAKVVVEEGMYFNLSLSWDGDEDCDISAVELGKNLALLNEDKHNIVYYEDGFGSTVDKAVQKGKDQRDGSAEGFDEQLRVYTQHVDKNVARIIIIASIYGEATFADVPNSILTISDNNGNQLKSYNFKSETQAVAVGYFEIKNNQWVFKKLNKSFEDLESAIMHYVEGIN